MNTDTSTIASAVSAALNQNTACQSNHPAISPAIGRPMPPPMPSVALTSATPELVLSGGSVSLAMLIASGSTAIAKPCIARPITSTISRCVVAASTQPASRTASDTRIIRRLPCMSPRRPITGLAIAPLSTAAVATHDTLPAVVPSSSGRIGSRGSATVWVTDTIAPQ